MENQNTPKKKKKKIPKDSSAPKMPLTGYVRFMNDRREALKSEHPSMNFAELQKLLANEWNTLAVDKKNQYLNAADEDKKRYSTEMEEYKKSDTYKDFKKSQNKKTKKKKKKIFEDPEMLNLKSINTKKDQNRSNSCKKEEPKAKQEQKVNDNLVIDFKSNIDIPIYTDMFLEHNKACEQELRQLRKSTTDYEQQNAMLEKYIEHISLAIEKLENETSIQKNCNDVLQKHLNYLRSTFAHSFINVKLPGTKETANLDNIDQYVERMHNAYVDNSNQKYIDNVKNIITRINFNG